MRNQYILWKFLSTKSAEPCSELQWWCAEFGASARAWEGVQHSWQKFSILEQSTIMIILCPRLPRSFMPGWKNTSIEPDASSDPLRWNFGAKAIALNFFLFTIAPVWTISIHYAECRPMLMRWALLKLKYFVDLFVASWITFLTFLINFSADFQGRTQGGVDGCAPPPHCG